MYRAAFLIMTEGPWGKGSRTVTTPRLPTADYASAQAERHSVLDNLLRGVWRREAQAGTSPRFERHRSLAASEGILHLW